MESTKSLFFGEKQNTSIPIPISTPINVIKINFCAYKGCGQFQLINNIFCSIHHKNKVLTIQRKKLRQKIADKRREIFLIESSNKAQKELEEELHKCNIILNKLRKK